MQVSSYWQELIIGSIIVLAAVLDVCAAGIHVMARPCWRCATSPRAFRAQALRKVNLTVRQGEIVCLLGRTGLANPRYDEDPHRRARELRRRDQLEGREVFQKHARGFRPGISIVFQEFNLCPNLSAMENLYLGHEIRSRWVSHRNMREQARTAFAACTPLSIPRRWSRISVWPATDDRGGQLFPIRPTS